MHFLPPPPRFLSTGFARPRSIPQLWGEHRSRNLSRVLLSLSFHSPIVKIAGERNVRTFEICRGLGSNCFCVFLSLVKGISARVSTVRVSRVKEPCLSPPILQLSSSENCPSSRGIFWHVVSLFRKIPPFETVTEMPSPRNWTFNDGNVLEHVPSLRFRGENLSSGPCCFLSKSFSSNWIRIFVLPSIV